MLFGLSAVVSTQNREATGILAGYSVAGGVSTASLSCAVASRLGGVFGLRAVASQTGGERFGGGLRTWRKIEGEISSMARRKPLEWRRRMLWLTTRHGEAAARFCLLRVWSH